MLKISKNLLVEPNETVLIFSENSKLFTVHIVKTTLNTEYYNGFRVMITDKTYAYWPIKYSDNAISYDGLKPPKYVQKLTKQAFNLLERSFKS